METRLLEIDLSTATRWFNGTDKELKALAIQTYPELVKKGLPKSWGDLEEINGWFSNTDSFICNVNDTRTFPTNKNVFATKEQAEASLALAQLSQLMKVYNDGWQPNYKEPLEMKYTITFYEDKLSKYGNHNTMHNFLTFKKEKTRDLFLENFRDLIEKAKPLL
jgi:hypothetical protein